MIQVRPMTEEDIEAVANVQSKVFVRQSNCLDWITCNFRAFPRIQYYLIEKEGRIVGFIEWLQKSGFRKEVVLELEQMAVDPDFQKQGLGKELIIKSIPLVEEELAKRDAGIKHIMVTTRADNYARKLYENTLGAVVEASISNLYSADEVIMIARNFKKPYAKA